jgi:selenocysteine lyase/cysteine desulfurase
VAADEFQHLLRDNTKLIAVTHASNVTGAIQPASQIGHVSRTHGALFLLDAAQTAGHIPLDVQELNVDLLAAPGHKGFLGPLGTGLLYVGPRADVVLRSFRQGGTGTRSEDDRHPQELPLRMEAGNLNVAGLYGLGAGLAELSNQGVSSMRCHEAALTDRLVNGLTDIDGIKIHGPRNSDERVSVTSFQIDGLEPGEISSALDVSAGIECRSGLHCAPLMHRSLGTDVSGGTVRISLGPFNTIEHIDTVIESIRALASTG